MRLIPFVLAALFTLPGATASAQITETPIPFDTAGKIRAIAPVLAERLKLGPPTWPVTGQYVEARMLAVGSESYVISVQRPDGRIDRYPMTATEFRALRLVMANAAETGRITGEETPATISDAAGGKFIRNQMILGLFVYGPALATLTHDAAIGTAAYLGSIGATYFALDNNFKNKTVTKAQNNLATSLAWRGPLMGGLALETFDAHIGDDARALGILVTSVGGSVAGYHIGRGLTNGEVAASTTGSTMLALTSIGALGTFGLFDHVNETETTTDSQVVVDPRPGFPPYSYPAYTITDTRRARAAQRRLAATALLGGVGGYFIGMQYPRRVSYGVTGGDVSLVHASALLGAMAAAVPFATASGGDEHIAYGVITAGYVAGALVGDRKLARTFDHTDGEARIIGLGTVAGAVLGAIPPVLAESDDGPFILGSITLGAIAGLALAEHNVRQRAPASRQPGARPTSTGPDFDFSPAALMMTAAKQRGTHSLLSIRF
jgi:hypothetical protein